MDVMSKRNDEAVLETVGSSQESVQCWVTGAVRCKFEMHSLCH